MPRRPRSQLPDGTFHVTTRSAARYEIFIDDVDRQLFLSLVESATRAHDSVVHAFCLLTSEYQIVLETTQRHLADGFKRVNGIYAQSFNARHDRRGHLFGDRFASWPIESEEQLVSTCEGVLLSPVEAGLCRHADDWPWSGSRLASVVK